MRWRHRTSQRSARGITTTYTYDALNRLTAISYPNTALNVSIGYDLWESNCTGTQIFEVGRMTHYIDSSGSTQFCFDRFGNLSRKVQSLAAAMYNITDSGYDKMGRPMELTEPRGTAVYYTRDGLGRITGISYQLSGQGTQTTLVSNVGYLPFGPVSSITYGTGASARTLNRTYDQDYVIGSVKDTGSGGLDLNYSRDLLGNLTQINNTGATSGNKYLYDGLYRLTGVKDLANNPVAAYTYDATGNRTSKTVGGVTSAYTYYPTASHWLYNVQGSTGNRSYDAAGNTTNNGNGLSFVFDNSGRMGQVLVGGVSSKVYGYDARGERVEKTHSGDPSQTLKTVFDEQGHILGDYDGANNIIDEMIWMDDLPVGVVNGTSGTVDYIEPLPPAPIELRDGQCGQHEIVGEEDQRLARLGILESDAPQWRVEVRSRVVADEQDSLIADQPCAAVDWMRVPSSHIEIRLAACHEEAASLVEPIEAFEVDESTIYDVERTGLWK